VTRDPFDELGLEPGSDSKAIRRAYAQKLRVLGVSPPLEAFEALRDAYSWALALANGTASPGAERDTPPDSFSDPVRPEPQAPPVDAPAPAAVQPAFDARDWLCEFSAWPEATLETVGARLHADERIENLFLRDAVAALLGQAVFTQSALTPAKVAAASRFFDLVWDAPIQSAPAHYHAFYRRINLAWFALSMEGESTPDLRRRREALELLRKPDQRKSYWRVLDSKLETTLFELIEQIRYQFGDAPEDLVDPAAWRHWCEQGLTMATRASNVEISWAVAIGAVAIVTLGTALIESNTLISPTALLMPVLLVLVVLYFRNLEWLVNALHGDLIAIVRPKESWARRLAWLLLRVLLLCVLVGLFHLLLGVFKS